MHYLIGRKSVAKADILLDNDTVSAHHASFFKQGSDYVVEDSGSTNGTFVNGKKVSQSVITAHDTLHFGEYRSSLQELITLSSIDSEEKVKDSVVAKQKCPDCGMIIEKDSICSFCN
jgi:pSer/pThr/pTyr-binding forkhead associated (FHA) protein